MSVEPTLAAMADVLDLAYRPPRRDRIVRKSLAAHPPASQKSFGNNDVVRFTVSPQHEGLLLFEAHLHIRGALVKKSKPNEKSTSTLANNALANLFDEARIELNGKTIDETRHIAATTAMKTYVSYGRGDAEALRLSAWSAPDSNNNWLTASAEGVFEGILPLARLFGFCEDYKRAVFNATVDLYLVRARSDYNAIAAPTEGDAVDSAIVLEEVELRIPQIIPDLDAQIKLLRPTAANKAVPVYFRNWETIIVPTLGSQTTHNINLGGFKSHPICALVGFQTDREHQHTKDASHFDHIALRDISLFIDNVRYPRRPFELDFSTARYTDAYDMFACFQQFYYQRDAPHPLITPDQFRTHAPVFVIDTSHHEQDVVPASVQIRLVFHTSRNVADKTNAYVLLIFDAAYEYTPVSRQLNQI